jgi:hypothetical protein
MPKIEIKYSNTIIYKIYCKDETIKDIYVGHTTNFIKRKYEHKKCYNMLSNKHEIYNAIRKNGGWENWDIIEIAKYNCKNHTEARIKELEHYEILKPKLTELPLKNVNCKKSPKIFTFEDCDYLSCKINDFQKHLLTRKHKNVDKMLQNVDKKSPIKI